MRIILRTVLMIIILASLPSRLAIAQRTSDRSPSQACLAIADDNARLSCIKALIFRNDTPSSLTESWNVIRSQDPSGARIVSIARSADPIRSDLDLAGLMIRCTRPNAFEVVVALVAPLQINTKRTVKLESGPASLAFEAMSITPGSLLLMPPEATDAINAWKDRDELEVMIENVSTDIKGKIQLAGLAGGLRRLTEACAVP